MYCCLTKHGVSAGRNDNSPILVGPEVENTVSDQEKTESSAVLASSKGICLEAPCGAAEQNPDERRTGGTPLIGVEHLSIGSQTSEKLEGLTEKVGTLGLQARRRINVALPGSGRGRPDFQRLLLGTLVVTDLDPRWLISHIISRSSGHLGLYKEEDLLRLSGHTRRAVADRCQARVNDSGRPEALRRTGVLEAHTDWAA